MNKKQIIECFDNKIALRCIQYDGCEWGITGKYCRITPLDGERWDLWLCNPKNIAAGLGARRLNRIIRILSGKMPATGLFTELTGEAYTQHATTELILNNLALLGIFRKKQISAAQRELLVARLRELRAA